MEADGFIRLILSDYRAFSDLRGDGAWRRRILLAPRLLLNPSLHAVVLVRLSNASPQWLHWFWRNILLWKHSSEIVHRSSIGPGLILPHPFGLTIGRNVRIGRGVTIAHNVSIGANFGSLGVPVIGDRAVVCTGAMVFGAIEIGEGSILGAGALVDFDVPAGSVVRAARGQLLERRAEELLQAQSELS